MKPSACPRLFEVEALRNGRLTGAERASFERHLTMCAACSREAEELAKLGQALRESQPATTDELQLRRERTRLLAAFDHALLASESPWPARRRVLGPVLVAALLAGLLLFWRARPVAPPELAENVVIRGDGAALWARRIEDNRDRIVLERGTLWIQVGHAASKLPLLVALPDGELEDTGTTFSVTVEAGRTTRVVVDEGSVILRLRGQTSVALGAGQAWTALPSPPTAAGAAPRVEPSAAAELSRPAQRALPARSSPDSPTLSASALARDASSDFRAAVAALNGGGNTEAAARFARFLEQHPRDARAEDAAYLRVLALRRGGEQSAMKSAALAYLRRYPAGFRRSEVESLAR